MVDVHDQPVSVRTLQGVSEMDRVGAVVMDHAAVSIEQYGALRLVSCGHGTVASLRDDLLEDQTAGRGLQMLAAGAVAGHLMGIYPRQGRAEDGGQPAGIQASHGVAIDILGT